MRCAGIWHRWKFHLWCITRYRFQGSAPLPNSIPRSARRQICLCSRVLSLPMHPSLADFEVEKVIEGVREFFKK